MPDYSYKLKNGKSLNLKGDTMPSDEEVEAIAKENGVELLPAYTDPTPIPDTSIPPVKEEEFEPINVPIEQLTPQQSREPEPESGLQRLWKGISEPLTNLPSRMGRNLSNSIDQPSVNRSPLAARLQGFMGGAIEGLGDVASDMTSPINLASTILSGGESIAAKQGLRGGARLLGLANKGANSLTVGHGGMEALNPNSTWDERGRGLMEIAGGMAGMQSPAIKESHIPLVKKPNLAVGTTILIDASKGNKNYLEEAIANGFAFEGVSDTGKLRFKKIKDITSVDSEAGVGKSRVKLGPDADAAKGTFIQELLNFPRAAMTSFDMSAPLRQGMLLAHRGEYWKALPSMFKAWGSEEAFNAVQQSIADKPLFKPRTQPMMSGVTGKPLIDPKTGVQKIRNMPSFAEDAGLHLTDLKDFSKREEKVMSNWAEKVPLGFGKGVRASNRAYTAFLNKLRADTFESLMRDGKNIGIDGNVNVVAARALADFVNTATGRGSLDFRGSIMGHQVGKNLEMSATTLNSIFFAPRLIASRIRMFDPRMYIMGNKQVRKEAIKSVLTMAAFGNTVGQLVKHSGMGTVESDPTNPDFGKIKIGATRIDPWSGFQQYIVVANKFMQGRSTTSDTLSGHGKEYNLSKVKKGPYDPTYLSTAADFGENKLNPWLTFGIGMLRGRGRDNKPFNVPEEVLSRAVPLFVKDVKELVTENPYLVPGIHPGGLGFDELHPENLPAAIPEFFGAGVQRY